MTWHWDWRGDGQASIGDGKPNIRDASMLCSRSSLEIEVCLPRGEDKVRTIA